MYVGAASQHVLRMSFVPEQEAILDGLGHIDTVDSDLMHHQ